MPKNLQNFTNYGSQIVPFMKKFGVGIKLLKMKLFWEEDFEAPVADLLTGMGHGYSFNIAPENDMFEDLSR